MGTAQVKQRQAVDRQAVDEVSRLTRWVDDFPEAGIRFADLTPVFADAQAYRAVITAMAVAAGGADMVAAVDARGFLLGAGLAVELGTGVVAVRKAGKLPPPTLAQSYTLEYGAATLELPAEGIDLSGRRVVVIDDVLATGGTLEATAQLVEKAGAEVIGICVVLEIEALGGRHRLGSYPLTSLVAV